MRLKETMEENRNRRYKGEMSVRCGEGESEDETTMII